MHHLINNLPIIKGDYLVDPFKEEEHLIHTSWINRYFKTEYKLLPMEIWNLLHGIDLSFIPKCSNPKCNNQVTMNSRHLNRGPKKYCSIRCKGQHKMDLMHSDPQYSEMFANAQAVGGKTQMTNYNNWQWKCNSEAAIDHRNKMKSIQDQNLNGYVSVAKSNRTKFLNIKTENYVLSI